MDLEKRMNLREKVVIITGASSGIGKGCAEAFANRGSFLALTGRNVDTLKEVKEICISKGVPQDKVMTMNGDLVSDDFCRRFVDAVVKHFGKIDVFVQNAGTGVLGTAADTLMKDYDLVMNVNIRSTFLLTQLVLPSLFKTKGNIVYVSSILSFRPSVKATTYCMSKAAMDQLARGVSLEVKSKGVRVNTINPGYISTTIRLRSGFTQEEEDKINEGLYQQFGRGVGDVTEIADSVVFLASDLSSFTTGSSLVVDGGYSNTLINPLNSS